MRWTEKQIEEYLEIERRELTGSAGVKHSVSLFRILWITYDGVRIGDRYTEAELVDWAERRVAEEGIDFAAAMRSNLGWIDSEIKRQCGPAAS